MQNFVYWYYVGSDWEPSVFSDNGDLVRTTFDAIEQFFAQEFTDISVAYESC